MRSWWFAALAGLIAAAPFTMAAAPPLIAVQHAWFRYLLPQIPAGGFFTLHNAAGSPVVLTGVSSPSCGMAMLHRSVTSSGVERMTMVRSITVPAHGNFTFAPGGYHIMCMQPHMKPGTPVDVTLMFAGLPPVTARFAVYGADGKPGPQ